MTPITIPMVSITESNLSQTLCKKLWLSSIDLKVFGELPSKLVLVFLHKEVPYISKESFYPFKRICEGLNGHEGLSPHTYHPVSKLSVKGKFPSLLHSYFPIEV